MENTNEIEIDAEQENNMSPPPAKRLRTMEENAFACPICSEDVRPNVAMATRCGHVFCQRCISKSYSKSSKCPQCQKRIRAYDELTQIYF